MSDLITAIIISASGYGAFLAIGLVCLVGYNVWNRRNMERNFETNEAFSARLEKPEARLESGLMSRDGSSLHHSTMDQGELHGSIGPLGRLSYARSQRHRASSTPSLSESAINDIFQGGRRSTQPSSTLVEEAPAGQTWPWWKTLGGKIPGWQSTARRQHEGSRRVLSNAGSVEIRDSWEL